MPIVYKAWNCARSTRKGVAAQNFEEFKNKSCKSLGYGSPETLRVVLECDGTEVLGQSYFSTLSRGTAFIILREGESWTRSKWASHTAQSRSVDQPDSSTTAPDEPLVSADLDALIHVLRSDISKLVTLDQEELELLSELDGSVLANHLNITIKEGIRIKNKCQEYLDDIQDSQDALSLLKMLGNAKSAESSTDGATSAALKTSDRTPGNSPEPDSSGPDSKRKRDL